MRQLEIGVTCTKVSWGTTIYFEGTYIFPLFTDCPPWESNTRIGRTAIPFYCTTLLGCHNKYHSTNLFSQNSVEKKNMMVSAVSSWAYTLFLNSVNFHFWAQCLLSVWCLPKRGPSVEFFSDIVFNCQKKKSLPKFYGICQTQVRFWSTQVSEFFISKFRFLSDQVAHSRSLLRKLFFF